MSFTSSVHSVGERAGVGDIADSNSIMTLLGKYLIFLHELQLIYRVITNKRNQQCRYFSLAAKRVNNNHKLSPANLVCSAKSFSMLCRHVEARLDVYCVLVASYILEFQEDNVYK